MNKQNIGEDMCKNIYKYLSRIGILATFATFVACSNDIPAEYAEGEEPIVFTTGSIQSTAYTRASTDNNWTGITEVAVKIGEVTKLYTVSASGNSATLSSETPFYWHGPSDTRTVNAWWPYNDDETYSKPDIKVKADQSELANFQASDYIEVNDASVTYSSSTTPSITFSHRTAKITVNLLEKGDIEEQISDISGATVTLMNTSASYIEDGTEDTEIIPYPSTDGTISSFTALLAPQTIGRDTKFLKITVGDFIFYYAPDEALELKAAIEYTFNVTVGIEKLKVSVEITRWDNEGNSTSTELLPD